MFYLVYMDLIGFMEKEVFCRAFRYRVEGWGKMGAGVCLYGC